MYPISSFSIVVLLIFTGCATHRKTEAPRSYEAKVELAEKALAREETFEARQWLMQAFQIKPQGAEAQELMAKVIDKEIAKEKFLSEKHLPEELTPEEKTLQIKTWLERCQSFLEIGEFDEALLACDQVFLFDPENSEASRLMDKIRTKAKKDKGEESLFLQEIYQEEINKRIDRYIAQAEEWLNEGRTGAARLAVEKILLLDSENTRGQKLLERLDKEEDAQVLQELGIQ